MLPQKRYVRFTDFFATLPDKRRLISMYGDSGFAGVLQKARKLLLPRADSNSEKFGL
jgi:hypothetical protein